MCAGRASAQETRPADSLHVSEPQRLQEVIIQATAPRKVVKQHTDGSISLDGALLGEQPSLMGTPDAVALLRTMPEVATTNDLQAKMNVRGSSTGANLYQTDGARIVAPLHMLGLFSAYNPSYYRAYEFNPGSSGALTPSLTAGCLNAETFDNTPDTLLDGSVSVGLIESRIGLHIPLLKGRSALAVGARRSYINLLFPDILKLGDTHVDYGFTDLNLGFQWLPGGDGDKEMQVNIFANRDQMTLASDKYGSKDGRFGWRNLAASASYRHNRHQALFETTYFNNQFELNEGGYQLLLPGSLLQLTGRYTVDLMQGLNVGCDMNYRRTGGQYNKALVDRPSEQIQHGFEANVATSWQRYFGQLQVTAGLRLVYYHCADYHTLVPQPRLRLAAQIARWLGVHAFYGRYTRFDRLVEESTAGLPADFWINASSAFPAEDVHSFELGSNGVVPGVAIHWQLAGYYKILRHQSEFAGNLLSMTNSGFDPVSDGLLDGHGYAWGVSVTLLRQIGELRGRVAYNYGRSRLRFDRYGSDYMPSSHDRPHDLSATLTWQPVHRLTLSASYTYATGTPYTRAKYGYMIGGNLICEYFPHNSSRLPDYKRLDLSATWRLGAAGRHRLVHLIGVSVYNALCNRNVLFSYTSYSLADGITQKQSVMRAVIPSVSYTVEF